MPILLLKNKDIDLITGKRNTTIRRLWKTPLYMGDRLYCYWNILSKEREKLFEAEVTRVKIITFKEVIHDIDIAHKLGFKSLRQLEDDLRKSYPNNTEDDDEFQVFTFKKLPVDQWEGSAINQKKMIIRKADVLFELGKYEQSSVCYKAALEYDDNDAYLLNKIGDNLTRLGQFGDAIKHYKKAIKIEPNNEYLHNNMAIAYIYMNDYQKALDANTQALKLNSQNTTVLYWRGLIYEMLNDFERALKFFDYVLRIDDKDPEVWNERATILNMMGKSEEALLSYDKSIELCLESSLDDAAMWASKANTLLGLQRYEEAIECYDNALKTDKHNPIILNNKGVAYMELDKFEDAIECFTKVLVMYPDNPDAQVLQEVCLDNL